MQGVHIRYHMGRRVYFTIVCLPAVCAKLRVSRTPRPARGRLGLRAPRAARGLMSDDRCECRRRRVSYTARRTNGFLLFTFERETNQRITETQQRHYFIPYITLTKASARRRRRPE
jgi:hypothetical protein